MSDIVGGLVVHILKAGRAYCGIAGLPSEWPPGHRWVSFEDSGDATCPGCSEAFDDRARRTHRRL